tara:strand:- start:88 stop:243 length:156 start_codon:yes stop_codon:yes gene_type:complete
VAEAVVILDQAQAECLKLLAEMAAAVTVEVNQLLDKLDQLILVVEVVLMVV